MGMAARLAWASFIVAVGLIVWGMIAPPPGQMHHSVLVGSGMFLLFTACAIFGFINDRKNNDRR